MRRQQSLVRFLATLALLSHIGCAQNDIPQEQFDLLSNADQYVLLSLDPSHERSVSTTQAVRDPPGPTTQGAQRFHGYRILGQTSIQDPGVRTKLNDALRAGAKENTGVAAACFNPRHGIYVTRGGKSMDFVICFECLQAAVYEDTKPTKGFLVTESPQPVFDNVLREAGVALPER